MSEILIAKPGFNAETETDIRNFIFNSNYNTMKLRTIITSTLTVNDSQGGSLYYTAQASNNIILPADVTYVPYYFSYITCTTFGTGLGEYNNKFAGDGIGYAWLQLDTANVLHPTMAYNNGGTTPLTYNFIIYVFANPM